MIGDPAFADQAVQWLLSTGVKYTLGLVLGMVLALLLWALVCAMWDGFMRWWNAGNE